MLEYSQQCESKGRGARRLVFDIDRFVYYTDKRVRRGAKDVLKDWGGFEKHETSRGFNAMETKVKCG